MSLLEITHLTHSFGDSLLYKDAGLTLNKGEHMGIVGRNGAGKSTLIKICTRQVVPDCGQVVWQPHTTIGYLDQYAEIAPSLRMEDFLRSAFTPLYQTESRMLQLYEQAAAGDAKSLFLASQCEEKLELNDFYSIDTFIQQVVTGLGLASLGLDRPMAQMSGGQRAKVILAKLLLESPDVLLLDEPTNFLDKEQVAWLAEFLSSSRKAFMVVSHDYDFLDKIATRICDVDHGTITKYYGTYSEFLYKKVLLQEDYTRKYTAQQKERKKLEDFIERNRAGRKSKMARGRQKQLDRMERLEAPSQSGLAPKFSFKCLPLTNTEHLSVCQLAVGYDFPLLSDITFRIQGGQKIVLTGFNGIGKSTLLKTLLGQLPALSGTSHFSSQVTPGYFEQNLHWNCPEQTPLQIVSNAFPQMDSKAVRTQLAQCGILRKQAVQPIGTLSGGEQSKVKLCLVTMTACNFLILDEPTNHLDAQAKEALKKALSAFPGTVLLVSHEEAFYHDWAHQIISLEGKRHAS